MARTIGPILLVVVGTAMILWALLLGWVVWYSLNRPGYEVVYVSDNFWQLPVILVAVIVAGISCWYGAYRWRKR